MYIDSYIAGVMDSEGSFVLNINSRNGVVGSLITITNIDLNLLGFIKENFGGTIVKDSHAAESRRPCYKWVCAAARMDEFIQRVLPFLIVKREQALLMQKFRKTVDREPKCRPKMSDEMKSDRLAMKKQMQILNGMVASDSSLV